MHGLIAVRVAIHLPPVLRHQIGAEYAGGLKALPMSSALHDAERERLQELQPYRYEPLPGDRYIRLLKLKRPPDKAHDDAEYELVSVSLDHMPSILFYRAVSYTWGQSALGSTYLLLGEKTGRHAELRHHPAQAAERRRDAQLD